MHHQPLIPLFPQGFGSVFTWMQTGITYIQDSTVVLLLLDAWLKSVVILGLAGAVCFCWKGASAAARHWVWFVAMISLLFLPWMNSVMPAWPGPRWAVSANLQPGNQVTLAIGLASEQRGDHSMSATQVPAAGMLGDVAFKKASSIVAQLDARWWLAIPLIWFMGLVLVLAYGAVGHLQLRNICRHARVVCSAEGNALLHELCHELGIRRPVTLLQSTENVVPMTWGWLRPKVLLPAGAEEWSEERQRIVLWHELAHIQRRDCLMRQIVRIVCALYWFNPLVWLAAQRIGVERERACDDLVLKGGWQASDYANHLVELAQAFRGVPQGAAIAMARSSGLKQRVTDILDCHRNRNRVAKMTAALTVLAVAGLGLFIGGCTTTAKQSPASRSIKETKVSHQLKRFVTEKEAQAIAGAKAEGKEMLPEYRAMFAAAARNDWLTISNIWEDLRKRAPQYEGSGPKDDRLHGTAWQTILETWGAFGNIVMGGKDLVAFGKDTIEAIPLGSIYFGGTDPGRCVITALQKSHVHADPFFTITQNALADGSYLQYLRGMYGGKIYTPTDDESKGTFAEYLADAERRLKEKKLKPGENVKMVEGKAQVSGQVAVMAINALLAKMIFDKNPEREFYIEESFPLDWMYPHLLPNGPIMKIHRQPLSELSDEIIQRDRAYWTRALKPMIGNWLKYETPLQEVIRFAEKAYAKPPITGPYVPSDAAQKWGSKLRSSIAGVYVWRMSNTSNSAEKQRMAKEADFAFRQAFAMCPTSPEVVFRYANFLSLQGHFEDALVVAETVEKLDPENKSFHMLVEDTKKLQSQLRK